MKPESDAALRLQNLPLGSTRIAFYRPAMRPLRALVIYIAVVFVGGALLAPWPYWLVQTGAQTSPKPANAPFHRYVNRSWLIPALAGLWPLLTLVVPRFPAPSDKPFSA